MVSTGGESPAAKYVQDRVEQCIRRLQESNAFGVEQTIRGALADVWRECSRGDWDGYGAMPVSEASFVLARDFLRSLPLGTPTPSIGAEPDGEITLEWGREPRRRLSVSVSPGGDLHFAAVIGAFTRSGTVPFFGDVPPAVLRLIALVEARYE